MTTQVFFATVLLLIATEINIRAFTTVSSSVKLPKSSFRLLKETSNIDPISVRSGTALDTIDVEVDKVLDKNEKFDWFKAWYPIVNVEILDPEMPHRFQLLGENIVVWNDSPIKVKDKDEEHHSLGTSTGLFQSKKKRPKGAKRDASNGTWRAFVDECPHRKVPLSEGRVEDDGTLLCSYHAWRFAGDGKCVAVPQISSPDALIRIKRDPKTNCNAYPTQVINGVLFVWPSSDKDATLESALKPVVHRPDPVNKENAWMGPWNYRELPYGADFFIENVVDSGKYKTTCALQ
jgi:nitrite reductase/ring-hydroxylating ferredoxin subunit